MWIFDISMSSGIRLLEHNNTAIETVLYNMSIVDILHTIYWTLSLS